jgi:uncharacterized protein involved in exopolysaccharide biosynthesis
MSEGYSPSIVQADEIDLRELAQTIGKYKFKLIGFTLVVTAMSMIWTLSKPNIYKSQAILVPQEQSKSVSLGGLSALAGMAGVDLGGSSGMTPDQAYQFYLDDYVWMREFLIQTKLLDRINAVDADKNYHFALGINNVYQMMKSSPKKKLIGTTPEEQEKILFETYQMFKTKLVISSDKKSSLITIACSDPDGKLARDIVTLFLERASTSLRESELSDMDKKIGFYTNELRLNDDVSLKTQLSSLMSALIQKRVLAQASDLYNVKLISKPSVAYVGDKEGPKRGLIVEVAFVTSLILGIFGIFFWEFIRTEKEDNS